MTDNPNAADGGLESTVGDGDQDPNVNVSQDQGTGTDTTDTQPGEDWEAKLEAANEALRLAKEESKNWRDRFTGMQGKYQQEKEKWEKAMGNQAGLPDQLAKVQADYDKLQSDHAMTLDQVLALETEKEVAEHALERKNIIFKDFPGLIAFEADGLLPDGTGDELKTKLTAFSEKMTKIGGDAFEAIIAGSSPPSPTSSEVLGEDQALDGALKAFREGDMEAYNKLYGQAIELDNVKE